MKNLFAIVKKDNGEITFLKDDCYSTKSEFEKEISKNEFSVLDILKLSEINKIKKMNPIDAMFERKYSREVKEYVRGYM